MALPSAKELSKLAKACRKLGITHFECDGIKFDLGHQEAPKTKAKAHAPVEDQSDVETDGWENLSEEAKIAWSTGVGDEVV